MKKFLHGIVLLAAFTVASSAQAAFWKCQSSDGARQFPIVAPVKTDADQNVYYAMLRLLGITRDEAKAMDLKCQEVMGLNDPRPWNRDLANAEWQKANVNCLPDAQARSQRYGPMFYKLMHDCRESLGQDEARFLVGMMAAGHDCGFSTNASNHDMVYIASVTVLSIGGAGPIIDGKASGIAMGCSRTLEQLTAKGVAYFDTHPEHTKTNAFDQPMPRRR